MGTNLGDLLRQAGLEGAAADDAEPAPADAVPGEPEEVRFAPKVVARRTRKGRGGRTVTVITGIESGHAQVLERLKRELGVGARLEDDGLVLQGDQVERVARWLESRGAKKVVRS